jgi:pyruvate formate lyase activating enzyme
LLPPIRGLIESSLLEWEGKVSAVVCLQGCNLRCPFCHSHNLISQEMPNEVVPLDGVMALLEDRRGWIDGVVVSGGEPTIHPELPEFLAAFKSIGCAVKLDTNGTYPGMLSDLIDMGLVDYVAMDLKAPLEPARYAAAAGGPVDVNAVGRSVEILRRGRVDYEFRTTVCPAVVSIEDLEAMARSIAGARRYVLQQFVPETSLRRELRSVRPYAQCDLLGASQKLRALVKNCQLRGQPAPELVAAGAG